MTTKPRIKRWSDAKLEMELGFAMLSNDNSPECKAWLDLINAEVKRRQGAGSDEWSGSPCPNDTDNYWIDDVTGERVSAATGERTQPAA